MERIAFTMQLLPGNAELYRQRHDDLWPELRDLLKRAGVADYHIFLDPQSNTLFATLLRPDDHDMDSLPLDPIMQRWWASMADLMETRPDNEPVTQTLQPVFYLA